jgi:hypothetical protein
VTKPTRKVRSAVSWAAHEADEIVLDGGLIPWNDADNSPVLVALEKLPGLHFVPIFSTLVGLEQCMIRVGIRYDRVYRVNDGLAFLQELLPELDRDPGLRIAYDIRTEGDKTVFMDIRPICDTE